MPRLGQRDTSLSSQRALQEQVEAGKLHPKRLEIAAFFDHPPAAELLGRASPWPPPDPLTLYQWGWDGTLAKLGKEACLRATIAAYHDSWGGGWDGVPDGSYERRALVAALSWIALPDEERRKEAGRIASDPGPWSREKVLANMAGARQHWRSAVGVMLTGNPRHMKEEDFHTICRRIHVELTAWALGGGDLAAERLVSLDQGWAYPITVAFDASRPPI